MDSAPPWYYDRALSIPVYRLYHVNRVRAVCDVLPRGVGLIVDVGCDGGTLTEIIRRCSGAGSVIGIDINRESVAYASRTKSGVDFIVADAEELPLGDGVADAVTMIEVLEHLDDPESALREGFRVLKSGGVIVVMVPNEASIVYRAVWSIWVRTFGRVWADSHKVEFTQESLTWMVKKAGFVVKRVKFVNLGMLIMVVGVKR